MNEQPNQPHAERIGIEKCRELLDEDCKKQAHELALTMRNMMYETVELLLDRLLTGVREARQNGADFSLPNQGVSATTEKPTKATPRSAPKQKATKPNHSIQGYLRPAEAAEYLGIARRTLSDWMRGRIIPYHKIARKVCLLRKADLDVAMGRFRTNAVGEDFRR